MNLIRCTSSILLAIVLIFIAGCGYADDENPIKDWKNLGEVHETHFDKWITDEYKAYLETLPPKEKKLAKGDDAADVLQVMYYEDGHGQHAIHIELPVDGTYWHHVLIYDKTNKRVKVLIFKLGHYAC